MNLQKHNAQLPALVGKNQVLDIVAWTYTLESKEISKETMILITTELSNLINTRFKDLTQDDIRTAIRRGIVGDYGDYYGINLKTFSQWLRGYKASKARREEQEFLDQTMPTVDRVSFLRSGIAEYRKKKEEEDKNNQ